MGKLQSKLVGSFSILQKTQEAILPILACNHKLVLQKLMQKLNSGISLMSGGQPWVGEIDAKKRLLTCTVAAAAGEGGWLTSDVKRSSGSVSDPR